MSSHSLPVDSDLTASRWHEIEDLLDEIAQVSKSALSADAFYRLLVARVVGTIEATGGAIWISPSARELRLEHELNLAAGQGVGGHESLAAHQTLVEDVLGAGEPRVVPPVGAPTQSGGHPADCWLIFHPFQAAEGAPGVIELLGHRDMTAAAARDCVRILAAVVELVEDFHRAGELRQLRDHAATWRQYDQFAKRVHESLDLDQTAYLIANDGRRMVGCDRMSVLVRHGAKYRAAATSGVDALERRSKIVRRLEQLAARCAAGGEPLWYHDGAPQIPDEIARPLDAYLDESHARILAVVPLAQPRTDGADGVPRVIGVLVAEVFGAPTTSDELKQRVTAVAGHAAVALNNSISYSRLPLARLGRMLAKMRWFAEAGRLPKTVLVILGIAVAAAALAIVPADFDVQARGEFQPKMRRDVFASDDGVVSELLAGQAAAVRAGDPLVVLRKPQLDLEFRRLAGEMQTAEKKLASVQAERLENAPDKTDSRRNAHELAAAEEELKAQLGGLREQHKILEQQNRDLVIRSPIDGQVLSWNVKQLLEARPVERGQALLAVGDLGGPWVLELDVPDDRAGYVLQAREELKTQLDVSFVLPSEPGRVHRGRVVEIALSTELDEKSEPMVLATVAFDKHDVGALRPGATANAKIHCGRRSIGYVWLHDLFNYVQSLWW